MDNRTFADRSDLERSKPTGHRGLVLGMLCFVYVLNFLDRQLVSILAKPIQDGLHITDSELGRITGEDTTTWTGYLAALADRRRWFIEVGGATSTDHGHPTAKTADLRDEDAAAPRDPLGAVRDASAREPGESGSADDAHEPAAQVEVARAQPAEFGHAQARRVQHLEHRAVAVALEIRTLRLLQKEVDLLARENLRKLLLRLLRNEAHCRIFRNNALREEIFVEVFDRGNAARNRRNGLALRFHPASVFR